MIANAYVGTRYPYSSFDAKRQMKTYQIMGNDPMKKASLSEAAAPLHGIDSNSNLGFFRMLMTFLGVSIKARHIVFEIWNR